MFEHSDTPPLLFPICLLPPSLSPYLYIVSLAKTHPDTHPQKTTPAIFGRRPSQNKKETQIVVDHFEPPLSPF